MRRNVVLTPHGLRGFASNLLACPFDVVSCRIIAKDLAVQIWRKALLDNDEAQNEKKELQADVAVQQQEAQTLGGELGRLSTCLAKEGEAFDDAERRAFVPGLHQKGQRFDQLRLEIATARSESERWFPG